MLPAPDTFTVASAARNRLTVCVEMVRLKLSIMPGRREKMLIMQDLSR